MDSGNPLDAVVNTWHAVADDPTELESGFILQLSTFYGAVDVIYSALVDGSASEYRAYDLADPEPRAPVLEEVGLSWMSPGAATLPPECAMVLSFEAPQQSGQPQARRRGRVYLGPLTTIVGSNGQISNATVDTVVAAAQNLLDASQAATTWSWQVYSRRNEASIEVMHAWADNAVDIQRSRGLAATYTADAV